MRGRFFFLMIVGALFSCEDPTTLPVSKVFNTNRLQTAFVDTFSVMTSVVQLDSVLTNGTGNVLLGKYRDQQLGFVSASSLFQIAYSGSFRPDVRYHFDSISMIMHYNHTYSGDTTSAVKINLYQLTEQMKVRSLPIGVEVKTYVFNTGSGFYNTTKFAYKPTPITSATVHLKPHTDSIHFRLPDSFGAKWFRLAQADSGLLFSNAANFVNNYFYGMRLDVDPSTDACVVGFKASNMAVRIYYHQLVGDFYKPAHTDFKLGGYQFNHIDYDRAGTALATAQKLNAIPTSATDNMGLVQSGTGLVTRLDFPSLKGFFTVNNGVILSAADLEIYPVRGSYPKDFQPPTSLALYATDASNLPLIAINGGTATLSYDLEYGVNTFYRYHLFPYIFGQLKTNANYFTSLILAPSGSQGASVQRVYFGDRFNPGNKIKLKLYYTYALN